MPTWTCFNWEAELLVLQRSQSFSPNTRNGIMGCRLTLPVFSKEGGNFTSKADHINPRDWCGNVSVANVNLHTCWLLEHRKAAELIPDMEAMLVALSGNEAIGMLSPLGKLLINQCNIRSDTEDTLANPPPAEQESSPIILTVSSPCTHEGNLEDALANEVPRNNVMSELIIASLKMSKGQGTLVLDGKWSQLIFDRPLEAGSAAPML